PLRTTQRVCLPSVRVSEKSRDLRMTQQPVTPTPEVLEPLTPVADAPSQAPAKHPPAIWFFFWGEFAERSSYYGMRAIVPLYLTTILHYADKDAGTIYYWFKMAAYFLPLVGGIIADRWLGRYWTIV